MRSSGAGSAPAAKFVPILPTSQIRSRCSWPAIQSHDAAIDLMALFWPVRDRRQEAAAARTAYRHDSIEPRYPRRHAAPCPPLERPLPPRRAVDAPRLLRRLVRRPRSWRLPSDRERPIGRPLVVGRCNRHRRHDLHRGRIRGVPRDMLHADRLGFPPDAGARGSARATGREAGTAAPRAVGRDRRTFAATPPYDREVDRWLGPMVRSERRVFVRSGELIVGVLNRATHGPESWSWFMTGVSRPHDEDFVWRGHRLETEEQAFAALASWWTRWLDWAGLEQVVPLHAEEARMTKHPRRAPNYDRKLARQVALADGAATAHAEAMPPISSSTCSPRSMQARTRHAIALLMRPRRLARATRSRRRRTRSSACCATGVCCDRQAIQTLPL